MLIENVVDKELFDRIYDVTIAASLCPRGSHMMFTNESSILEVHVSTVYEKIAFRLLVKNHGVAWVDY